jgi:hypothetical protein
MSIFAGHAARVPPCNGLLTQSHRPCFLLGQNARGLWVIRESTGAKAGVFLSREGAMRFARLESSDECTLKYVPNGLEFDYAA